MYNLVESETPGVRRLRLIAVPMSSGGVMNIGDHVREKGSDVVGVVIRIRPPAASWAYQDNGILIEFPSGFQLWRWQADLEKVD